jgi:hypothetical protein
VTRAAATTLALAAALVVSAATAGAAPAAAEPVTLEYHGRYDQYTACPAYLDTERRREWAITRVLRLASTPGGPTRLACPGIESVVRVAARRPVSSAGVVSAAFDGYACRGTPAGAREPDTVTCEGEWSFEARARRPVWATCHLTTSAGVRQTWALAFHDELGCARAREILRRMVVLPVPPENRLYTVYPLGFSCAGWPAGQEQPTKLTCKAVRNTDAGEQWWLAAKRVNVLVAEAGKRPDSRAAAKRRAVFKKEAGELKGSATGTAVAREELGPRAP